MRTLVLVNWEKLICRVYVNCSSLKEAKEKGLKTDGEFFKFNNKKDALKHCSELGFEEPNIVSL